MLCVCIEVVFVCNFNEFLGFLTGFEPSTFESPVQRSNHCANPSPHREVENADIDAKTFCLSCRLIHQRSCCHWSPGLRHQSRSQGQSSGKSWIEGDARGTIIQDEDYWIFRTEVITLPSPTIAASSMLIACLFVRDNSTMISPPLPVHCDVDSRWMLSTRVWAHMPCIIDMSTIMSSMNAIA